MPDPTTNFAWNPPNVAGDSGAWGTILNTLIDDVDSDLNDVKTTADAALPKAGGTMTGVLNLQTSTGALVAKGTVSGAVTLNLATANAFTATVGANTTFSFVGAPATSGVVLGAVLRLTNGGAFTVTWTNVKWAGGAAPALTGAGTDLLVFVSFDNGATWLGAVSVLAAA